MKKTISVLASLFMFASLFISCQHNADNAGGTGANDVPQTKEFTQPDLELNGLKPEASWAYVTYPLDEFADKEVTINFSADMKVVNNTTEDYQIWWQINNSGEYPALTPETENMFTPGESEKTVTGKATFTIKSGAVIYLTTHNTIADVNISVKNIKYTVSYVASTNENIQDEVTSKEFPTDIFTVGEEGSCGIQIGDGELEPFSLFERGQAASNIKQNTDGSVEWIATAAGGGGGGTAIYIKADKKEINIANYESIELEFVYSPITGKWNPKAKNPGFALRILPWDSTGVFEGYTDLEYFDTDNADGYGTCKKTISIPADFANKIIASSSQDAILGFSLKFNDYQRDNTDGDQLKVQLKKVKFNKKAGAVEDKPFDDGLTAAQRGSVIEINYPTKDYTEKENASSYDKHAWVYLPAGYDANDKETKYPIFILLHGFGQNENTWGLSNFGRGGKIKGYMDSGMASGDVEKFILVCATGVASKNWGPNGAGNDIEGFNAFGEELKNDLLPYVKKNFNVKEGRDNVALAGLSMGGGQTMNIGAGQCLDEISYFGAFSPALFTSAEEYIPSVEETFPELDINYLYMICGDADGLVIDGVRGVVNYIEKNGWDKLGPKGEERFTYTEVPGGTHDFPVWYQGFQEFIKKVFK